MNMKTLLLAVVLLGCVGDTVTITPEQPTATALGMLSPDTFHVTVPAPVDDTVWAFGTITRNGRTVTVTSTTSRIYVRSLTILADKTPTYASWQNQDYEWMTCDETIAVMTRHPDPQMPYYDCWDRSRYARTRSWGSSRSATVDCGQFADRVGHVRMYITYERWRRRYVTPRHDGSSYGRWSSGLVLVCD